MRTKHKILILLVLALTGVVIGALTFVQSRIDAKTYREWIEKAVQERLGVPLTVKGQVVVSLLPTPTIEFPDVELRVPDDKVDAPQPSLRARGIRLRSTLLSVISGDPEISTIVFDQPVLEVHRAQDNIIHWGWLGKVFLAEKGNKVRLDVLQGTVLYRNARVDREIQIKDIGISANTGDLPYVSGTFTVKDHILQFEAVTEAGETPKSPNMKFTLTSNTNDAVQLIGQLDYSGEVPQIRGKITFQSENALTWFNVAEQQDENSILAKFAGGGSLPSNSQSITLPIAFSGQWQQRGSIIDMTIDEFNGLNSAGAGTIGVSWDKNDPNIQAKLDFSAINYDYWRMFLSAIYRSGLVARADTVRENVTEAKSNPLPEDVNLSLAIKSKQVYFGEQIWKDTQFFATLDKGAITIHELNLQLPGESSLSLFGIVSQGGTREMRFEGNLETQGKSLQKLFTIFDASAMDLPEEELGAFRVRSNIYVSANQIRLSEADVKISELHLNGGMVAYFDKIPRFEADIRLNDIDFDYFRNSWRKQYHEKPVETYFLQPDKNQSFNWLKKLKASVDFKVDVDGFRFMERDGKNASFRIFAQSGEIGIYNIRLNYPESTLEAGFSLDVKSDVPLYNLVLNTNSIDTDYFRAVPSEEPSKTDEEKEKKPAAPRWSEVLFDMSWMEGWRGTFDISVEALKSRDWKFDNIKCKAVLDNGVLNIQNLMLSYWQGKAQLAGMLYGGKVPGISFSYSLVNVDVQDMLNSLTKYNNLSGRISINGKLATSGVNMKSWVSQAESELIMNGQGITVDGFDLQGVINAVAVSRTAADVLNNVNLALIKGKTEMSVEGGMNIKGGVLRTPGLTLKSAPANGSIAGEFRLIPWKMDLTGVFQFPTISQEKPPVMNMQLTGPIEKPDMGVDTSSLEAYVAKRLTGGSGK